MAMVFGFRFLLISHLLLLSVRYGNARHVKCPRSFNCRELGSLQFPFTKPELPDCGLMVVHNCDDSNPNSNRTIELEKNGRPFLELNGVYPQQNMITVFDQDLHYRLQSTGSCDAFKNHISIPANSPLISFDIKYNITVFKCHHNLTVSTPAGFIKHPCANFDIYHYSLLRDLQPDQKSNFSSCSTLVLPKKDLADSTDLQSFLSAQMTLDVRLSEACDKCHNSRGQCQPDRNKNFFCIEAARDRSKIWKLAVGLGLGLFIGLLGILIICWILARHYKRKDSSSNVHLQLTSNNTIDPYSNTDPERGRTYLGVPLFSYKELEKATNNFDHSRELGNGGFGSVYYGKLQDGREVAVKRLYDHNYRRVEQFMNEIETLTRLRHQNLVSLYGCTSCLSRELLLVYEYIPNKTVSCHLHGELANSGLLPWPVRIKIAIETATVLAFLHASDTVHRDVKTNNILLDNNFSVKVADFGLSRLFPDDVTHVSTAPQGTPGYVDPDYHHCYQLTSKSDVYSFGVVLIELISSMPAVDMSRPRDEINLANLAINKIQKSAIGELVDPFLGFESDKDVRRMIVSVAELAFQCLQRDRELRPSMEEVLEILKRIECGNDEFDHLEEVDSHRAVSIPHSGPIRPLSPPSPDCVKTGLLKSSKSLSSPKAVTDKWHSESTTTHGSV
ncbi:hypothetical protein QN277_029207 [Acacia crassicarpa]|uniref:Protein kinase domain-containing protein n=1 Tax=Acacia crassicarpa TaxID=499986 RepID=A0AAE1MFZ1_9FABA|nr:hypothetical protein QN277_029207 [Acacia crassicarpa]